MQLLFRSMKRQAAPTIMMGILYAISLSALILIMNSNSQIYYKISPYEYASGIVDFFLVLIVNIPFSFYTFFMKKDGFLEYASIRTTRKKYIATHFISTMIMCFLMIFVVNVFGVVFSCNIADLTSSDKMPTLSGYILGQMQMEAPAFFGVIWALYKAFIFTLICLFAQIIALYIDNLFLALCAPAAYVILENFFTAILRIERYSLTTTFVLNRLSPTAMSMWNLMISIAVFIVIIVLTYKVLKHRHEKK